MIAIVPLFMHTGVVIPFYINECQLEGIFGGPFWSVSKHDEMIEYCMVFLSLSWDDI